MDLITAPISEDPSKNVEKAWKHIMQIPALDNSIGTAMAVMGNPSFSIRKADEDKGAEAPSN